MLSIKKMKHNIFSCHVSSVGKKNNINLFHFLYFFILTFILSFSATINAQSNPVAIPMKYHVFKNTQKFIALAGYSDNITYTQSKYGDNPIQWGTRYQDAITDWDVESLPSNGTLYYQSTEITSTPYGISDPDELLYVPDNNYTGNDSFTFSVTDNNGSSNTATISLIIESSVTLPAGIPSLPSIFNTAAPTPATSGSTETDDWYIDNTDGNATDTPQGGESNPRHGTPDAPRLTIPPNYASFAAGARVFIAGGVSTPYTVRSGIGWHQWTCSGTSGSPVYIIGVNNGPNKPIITYPSGLTGSQLRLIAQYTIFEGITFKGVSPNHRPGLSGGNMVFRHVILDGEHLQSSGSGIGFDEGNNIVYYDMHIKRIGYTEPDLSQEIDVHGILLSVDNIWVLDNLIHGSSGDAMQLIGYETTGRYIGRNKLHSDNENALDAKGRYDLVFVENDVWDYRAIGYASSGSDGAAVIINVDKYGAPTRATISRNRIWDANSGVRHQGTYIWTTDNVFWHIHHNANTSNKSYGVAVGNNGAPSYIDRITNNTFDKVDGGIWIWAGANSSIDHQYVGNNFGELNSNSYEKLHFNINSEHDQDTYIDYNNYSSAALIEWGGTTRTLSWIQSNTSNSDNSTENRDPVFTNAANFDLTLQSSSPLRNDNVQHSAYQEFYDEYGLSIKFGAAGEIRPQDQNWDIGAYEYVTGTYPTEYTLTVVNSGSGSVSPGGGSYLENTVVTLTATPDSGNQFDNWSGDASGTNNITTVTMTSNKTVTANFSALQNYTVTLNTSGNGSASITPSGGTYLGGTVVTITATPNSGNEFDNWSGDLSSYLSPVQVTVNGNKAITANFSSQGTSIVALPPTLVTSSDEETQNPDSNTIDNNLGTRWSGYGDGTWIQYDLGNTHTISYLSIAWYNGDSRVYPFEIEVSSNGTNWTQVYAGSSSGTSTAQQVADFGDAVGRYARIVCHGYGSSLWNSITEVDVFGFEGGSAPTQFTLDTTIVGSGSVTLNPTGGVYDSATVVTVIATPDSGYQFDNWSGDASGTNDTTTVTMNSNKSVTATFVVIESGTVIQYDDFESGAGNYITLNNSEVYTGGTYAHEGSNAIRIWDNQGAHSSIVSQSTGFSVVGYVQIKIEFWLYTLNMDDSQVDRLQISYRANNESYQPVHSFYYDTDFNNDEFTKLSFLLDTSQVTFSNRTRLNFRSYAAEGDDNFYIDEIKILGYSSLSKVSSVEEVSEVKALPETYSLANYPNPFNPSTTIQYGLPEAGYVELAIYDMLGRKVADVFKGNKEAGTYRYTWNAKGNNGRELSSGVYFLSISSKDFRKTMKMMYLR